MLSVNALLTHWQSPSEYKELLDTEGLLSPQEVVFHIIPRHLGGANHVDNMIHASKTVYQRARPYKEGKSSSPVSLNWAGTWDDEWDGIAWVAFQIGITHMDRAITISQSLGNTKTGKKYLGPDASDFYSRGQELNRLLRRRQQRSGGLDRPLGKDEDKLKVSPTSPNPPPISPGSAGTKAPVAENPFADPTQLSVSGSFASTGSSSSSAPLEKPRRKSFVERLFGKH